MQMHAVSCWYGESTKLGPVRYAGSDRAWYIYKREKVEVRQIYGRRKGEGKTPLRRNGRLAVASQNGSMASTGRGERVGEW